MKNTVTIKKNRDFLRLYKKGTFFVGRRMVIYIKQNRSDINRIGITTVRNFGRSVDRNRVRRLIKENYRILEKDIKIGMDIVVSARKSDGKIIPDFREIEKEMKYLFRKLDVLK